MSFPGAGDQVDELADTADVEAKPGVRLWNHAAEAGIVDLDEVHRKINQLADLWLLGPLIEVLPAGFRCHPEHALSSVFVGGLEELRGRVAGDPVGGELIAQDRPALVDSVLDEDRAKDHVLVLGRADQRLVRHPFPMLTTCRPLGGSCFHVGILTPPRQTMR